MTRSAARRTSAVQAEKASLPTPAAVQLQRDAGTAADLRRAVVLASGPVSVGHLVCVSAAV